jgi:uncharacterized coiled-coil protein SlyX
MEEKSAPEQTEARLQLLESRVKFLGDHIVALQENVVVLSGHIEKSMKHIGELADRSATAGGQITQLAEMHGLAADTMADVMQTVQALAKKIG